MGVFPEPAPCADDAYRLVPGSGIDEGDAAVRWLVPSARGARSRRRRPARGLTGRVLTALTVGLALAGTLPQDALAPAAAAHDRIDLRAPHRSALPPMGNAEWRGLPPMQESPSTAELIQLDLDRLASEADDDGPLVFDTVKVPRPLVETILRAAKATDVDPVYLMALADKESSFRPEAQAATSSAEGLFQFLTGTWLELVRTFGAQHGLEAEASQIQRRRGILTVPDAAARRKILALRRDPYIASLMAGEMMKRDRARIEQRLGRDLKQTECYVAHLLGAASAGRFMQLTQEKPDQPAQHAFRAAARANRSLFFERQGKKTRSLTVAEVYERLDLMIDRRLDRFQSAAALAERIDTRRPGDALPVDISLVP
ncbi:transglycosylase SLT domain-containing protein [Methylobacterium sp. ID0610]|uniref:transglycosylase SLT domain-containing protein n=1 Tax=Methylobacterium carpenticola TaxID=3344827 RepID=UPI00368CBB59